jgi:hypothetical protein
LSLFGNTYAMCQENSNIYNAVSTYFKLHRDSPAIAKESHIKFPVSLSTDDDQFSGKIVEDVITACEYVCLLLTGRIMEARQRY